MGVLTKEIMHQKTENQNIDFHDAVGFFGVKVRETANPKSAGSLKQALAAFERFLDGRTVCFDEIDRQLLLDWLAWLFAERYSLKTAIFYLKNLASLYGKAVGCGLAENSDAFRAVQTRIRNLPTALFDIKPDRQLVEKLQKMFYARHQGSERHRLSVDIVLFALFCGGLSFDEIIAWKKNDCRETHPAIREIVDRYARPKNKYLFPLEQSRHTPNQLLRNVKQLFEEALSSVDIRPAVLYSDLALDLWCTVALRCALSPARIVSCAGRRPRFNPIFALSSPVETEPEERAGIRNRVIALLTDDPIQWYAMQLRPRTSFKQFQDRIESTVRIPLSDIYYPFQNIAKKASNKVVFSKRPVVSGLLYFKCRDSEIGTFFRNLGDLAWGYKEGHDTDCPYASIPQAEIDRLQTAIGAFAVGSEAFPVGTIPLAPGDRVEVIGGIFSGRAGQFDAEKNDRSGNTLYRLLLPDGNGIEWKVSVDPRLVMKVSDKKSPASL